MALTAADVRAVGTLLKRRPASAPEPSALLVALRDASRAKLDAGETLGVSRVMRDLRHYWRDLGFIFSFFLLVVSITNIAYTIFGFKLTEFFAVTFDTFHAFLHFTLNILVFSWLSYLLVPRYFTWVA